MRDILECKNIWMSTLYKHIYTLSLLVRNETVAYINSDGVHKNPNSTVKLAIVDVEGNFTIPQLEVSTDGHLKTLASARCQLFGLLKDDQNAHTTFSPSHTFQKTMVTESDVGSHLFLSSLLVVYVSMVIFPVIVNFMEHRGWLGKIQELDMNHKRWIWTGLSFIPPIIFTVWWRIACHEEDTNGDMIGCWWYFTLEMFFLWFYAAFRCISHSRDTILGHIHTSQDWNADEAGNVTLSEVGQCERRCMSVLGREGCLDGCRVMLASFSMLTPTVSWIMIKVHLDIQTHPGEIVWWVVSVASIVGFMSLAHTQEFKEWENKNK